MKQQSADSAKESEEMRIVQHLSFFVPHRLDELDEPYGSVWSAADQRLCAEPKSYGDQRAPKLATDAHLLQVSCL